MKLVTGRQRYDSSLKEWVPVMPPPRATGRLALKIDKSGQFLSYGLCKHSPYAPHHDKKTGRGYFLTRNEKREAIRRAADRGETLFLADEVYTDALD